MNHYYNCTVTHRWSDGEQDKLVIQLNMFISAENVKKKKKINIKQTADEKTQSSILLCFSVIIASVRV